MRICIKNRGVIHTSQQSAQVHIIIAFSLPIAHAFRICEQVFIPVIYSVVKAIKTYNKSAVC